jgi:hypothetical protein
LPAGSDKIILGTAFMQSVYSILSVEMPEGTTKVGLAPAVRSLGILAPDGQPIKHAALITFLSTLFVMVATGVLIAMVAKSRVVRRERKIRTMSRMNDPNFLLDLTKGKNKKEKSDTFTTNHKKLVKLNDEPQRMLSLVEEPRNFDSDFIDKVIGITEDEDVDIKKNPWSI